MKVADLQLFLNSLTGPLAASGGKKVADELTAAAAGLQPFETMTVAQFADFLRQAEEYHRTGILPAKSTSRRKAATPPDPAKLAKAVETLQALYERAGANAVDYSTIESEVGRINKSLKKDELVTVAKDFGIASTPKTKKAAAEAIQRRIVERKESVERTRF